MRMGSHPPITSPRSRWDTLVRETGRPRPFCKKDLLYLAGDRAGVFYLLEKGRVRLFKHSSQGRTLTLSIAEEGDIFGEAALLGQKRYGSHAQALTDGLAHAVSCRHLGLLLRRDPAIALWIMENLGQRARSAERRLGDLAFKSVPQRLAALLLDLAAPTVVPGQRQARLPHRYTHQQLADMINTHRETVTKVVNLFRENRLLEFDRRQIVLLDVERLREMALR